VLSPSKKLEPRRSQRKAAELAEKIGLSPLHELIGDSSGLRSWVLGRLCSRQKRLHSELRVKFQVGVRFLFERGQAAREFSSVVVRHSVFPLQELCDGLGLDADFHTPQAG